MVRSDDMNIYTLYFAIWKLKPVNLDTVLFLIPNHTCTCRMVLAIIAVIALVVIGLIGWCIWRFCKKKRPKGEEKKAPGEDDENALVDNEEANVEEVR